MNYNLMHNDYKVLSFITDNKGKINKIRKVFDAKRIPLAVTVKEGLVDIDSLNRWFEKRTNQLLIENGIITKEEVFRSKSLSLSDHYWVCEPSARVRWSEVSLFTNTFTYDCGNLLFLDKKEHIVDSRALYTADIALNGKCKKSWRISTKGNKGARFLIKMGTFPRYEEPINEVFGYKVAEKLNIPTAKYKMMLIHGKLCCKTKCFTTNELEFVSANDLLKSEPSEDSSKPVFERLIEISRKHGLFIDEFLEKMIMLDCIIGNTDRNLGNFGFLRKVSDLKIVSTAPLFDYGHCEGVKHIEIEEGLDQNNERLLFIKSMDFTIPNLSEIFQCYKGILDDAIKNKVIKEERRTELLRIFEENAEILMRDIEKVKRRNRRKARINEKTETKSKEI